MTLDLKKLEQLAKSHDDGNEDTYHMALPPNEVLSLIERIEKQESIISHLLAPSGLRIDEPGCYELNTVIFPDGSGLNRTWNRANPDHDIYPPISWRSAQEQVNELSYLKDRIKKLEAVKKSVDYYCIHVGHAKECISNSSGDNDDCLCGYTDTIQALKACEGGSDE